EVELAARLVELAERRAARAAQRARQCREPAVADRAQHLERGAGMRAGLGRQRALEAQPRQVEQGDALEAAMAVYEVQAVRFLEGRLGFGERALLLDDQPGVLQHDRGAARVAELAVQRQRALVQLARARDLAALVREPAQAGEQLGLPVAIALLAVQ